MVSNTGDSFQFYIDNIPVTQFVTDTFFTTSTLTDGQVVTASVREGSCFAMSNTSYTFTVDSIPNLIFNCSDNDQVICPNDTVFFSAFNADLYSFFINDVSHGDGFKLYFYVSKAENWFIVFNHCFLIRF